LPGGAGAACAPGDDEPFCLEWAAGR
jgi:hypothetical protein